MSRSTGPSGDSSLRVLMASVFYPRGGSAQVIRYLARALMELGHRVLVASGSLKGAGPDSDAAAFFEGIPLTEVDYAEAGDGFRAGLDPMSERFTAPFPPSYEDKEGVPDRAFHRVGRSEMEHLVASWRGVLGRAVGEFRPDVAHLHHLNHLHLASSSLPAMKGTAKIAHLHGTELKMLEEMRTLDDGAGQVALWREAMLEAAVGMDHFITISPDNVARARELLGLDDRSLTFIPNGVDTALFTPETWSVEQKTALLEELLVRSPRGWDESGVPGSIRYSGAQLGAFSDSSGGLKPVLAFVGRFLGFKRVPLLMEAAAEANRLLARGGRDECSYSLLVLGGIPGEWEGEHPYAAVRRLGVDNAFFSGWLPHERLAAALNLADVMVAPSYYEPFGQVFLEAMAKGIPVIATRSGGPLSFVVGEGERANGWFCEVDDVQSLASAIAEAVSSEVERRRRRGANALALVRSDYAWSRIAEKFERVYGQVLAGETARG